MSPPDISTSTAQERLEFIKEEFKCIHNCELCGKCAILHGREADEVYMDYIEGVRSFMEITIEQRQIR